jgi:hypothetical protein
MHIDPRNCFHSQMWPPIALFQKSDYFRLLCRRFCHTLLSHFLRMPVIWKKIYSKFLEVFINESFNIQTFVWNGNLKTCASIPGARFAYFFFLLYNSIWQSFIFFLIFRWRFFGWFGPFLLIKWAKWFGTGLFLKLTYWACPLHLPTFLDLFGSFLGCPNGHKIVRNGPNNVF